MNNNLNLTSVKGIKVVDNSEDMLVNYVDNMVRELINNSDYKDNLMLIVNKLSYDLIVIFGLEDNKYIEKIINDSFKRIKGESKC